jgi:hypothetical protein
MYGYQTYREKKLRPYFFQCCIKTSLIPDPAFSLLAAARIDNQAAGQLGGKNYTRLLTDNSPHAVLFSDVV